MKHLLNPKRIDRQVARKLPQLVEFYSRNPDKRIGEEYITLLANWIRNLEKRHYKQTQLPKALDARLDRILDFIEFAKEMPDKDGALIMARFSMVFSHVEMLRNLKHKRVALTNTQETKWKQYNSSQLRLLCNIATYTSLLENTNQVVNYENIKALWVAHRLRLFGKSPGEKAQQTFKRNYENYLNVIAEKVELEKSWIQKV